MTVWLASFELGETGGAQTGIKMKVQFGFRSSLAVN